MVPRLHHGFGVINNNRTIMNHPHVGFLQIGDPEATMLVSILSQDHLWLGWFGATPMTSETFIYQYSSWLFSTAMEAIAHWHWWFTLIIDLPLKNCRQLWLFHTYFNLSFHWLPGASGPAGGSAAEEAVRAQQRIGGAALGQREDAQHGEKPLEVTWYGFNIWI